MIKKQRKTHDCMKLKCKPFYNTNVLFIIIIFFHFELILVSHTKYITLFFLLTIFFFLLIFFSVFHSSPLCMIRIMLIFSYVYLGNYSIKFQKIFITLIIFLNTDYN